MATVELYEIKDGTAITTDSTTHVPLAVFNVSTGAPGGGALNNCSIFVRADCSGYDTTSNAAAGEHVAALFKVVAGVLTQVGATVHITSMIDDVPATPNTEFEITGGNTISYYAIGSTGETIQWFGRLFLTIYQPV